MKAMKAIEFIYLTAAAVCEIISAVIRTAELPLAMACSALNAMSGTASDAAWRLMKSAKGEER